MGRTEPGVVGSRRRAIVAGGGAAAGGASATATTKTSSTFLAYSRPVRLPYPYHPYLAGRAILVWRGPSPCPYSRTSCKRSSPKFPCTGFSEVRPGLG
jgi:hypothetical protein